LGEGGIPPEPEGRSERQRAESYTLLGAESTHLFTCETRMLSMLAIF